MVSIDISVNEEPKWEEEEFEEAYIIVNDIRKDLDKFYESSSPHIETWQIKHNYPFTEENQEVTVTIYLEKDGITYEGEVTINNNPD